MTAATHTRAVGRSDVTQHTSPNGHTDSQEAQRIARRVAYLERRLEELRAERVEIVHRLRASGHSQAEIADLLKVTKTYVQQLEKEWTRRHGLDDG